MFFFNDKFFKKAAAGKHRVVIRAIYLIGLVNCVSQSVDPSVRQSDYAFSSILARSQPFNRILATL